MIFRPVSTIKVGIDLASGPLDVGRLAIRDRIIYFEYERSFIERGLEISPLRLPLQPGLRRFDAALFDGLPGVFNDSLPDGWGRLLLDRALRVQGLTPAQASQLDRLTHVGAGGMGALTYEPAIEADAGKDEIDLDRLAGHALDVLEGQADEVIGELLLLNASSAGARRLPCHRGAQARRILRCLGRRGRPWLVDHRLHALSKQARPCGACA